MADLLAGYNGPSGSVPQRGPYQERAYTGRDLLEGIDIDAALAKSSIPQPVGGVPTTSRFDPEGLVADIRAEEDIPEPDLGELLSEGGKALEGTVGTGIELGAGLAGWPVGAVAATGAGLGEVLKGSSSKEASDVFKKTLAERSEQIAEPIREFGYTMFPTTRPERNVYTREGTKVATEIIDKTLTGAKKLANIERGYYGDYLKSIKEIDPLAGDTLGILVELMAFKAAHTGGTKVRRAFDRRMRKQLRDIKESPTVAEDLKRIVREEATPEVQQLLLEYKPELRDQIGRAIDKRAKEVTERGFRQGPVTAETGRRPIRMEGPAQPQRMLPAPEQVVKTSGYNAGGNKGKAREFGKTIEGNVEAIEALKAERQAVRDQSAALRESPEYKEAVARAVEQKATAKDSQLLDEAGELQAKSDAMGEALDNAEGRYVEESLNRQKQQAAELPRDEAALEAKRVRDAEIAEELAALDRETLARAAALDKAEAGGGKPGKYKGLRTRASKDLGGDVRFDSSIKQPDGSTWHSFTFRDGPAKGRSFTVMKEKGRVTKNDIVEAGREVLDDAQRIRKDEGLLREEGVIEEGRPEEGRTDLERQASEEPRGKREEVATEEVPGTEKAQIIDFADRKFRRGETRIVEELKEDSGAVTDTLPEGYSFLQKTVPNTPENVPSGFKAGEKMNSPFDGTEYTHLRILRRPVQFRGSQRISDIQYELQGRRPSGEWEMYSVRVVEPPKLEKFKGGKESLEVATEKELAETTDVIRGAKERAAAEETIARTQTPEEAQARVFEVIPEAEAYISRGEGAPKEIIQKLNDSLEGMDPRAGAQVIEGVERVIGEITRVEKMKEATAPMKSPKRPETVDPNTRRGARKVQDELDSILQEVTDAGGVVDVKVRRGNKQPDGTRPPTIIDFYSIRKGLKGQGRRQIMEAVDGVFELAAKHNLDIHSPVVNLEVAKTFKDLGATKDPRLPAAAETGLYVLKAEQAKKVVNAGGIHAYRSKMRQKATPEAVADRLALLKERNELFKGKMEDRIKAQRELEREISEASNEAEIERLRREQEADQALEMPEDHFNEGQYEQAAYREAELSEWDPSMVDYNAMDFARDLVDVFGDERGSFSAKNLTTKKIAALHRMWKKAKAEGAKLGEYFKAAMPNASDADIKRMEDFAERYFVKGEEFEVPGNTDFLKNPSARKWKKGTPDERTIIREGYPREWYDNWQEMPEFKFPKSTGGKLGTTPRAVFEEIPWLRDTLYRPWRRSQKIIKQRKLQMRDHFLKPLKKMVDKKSRKRIRDHAVLQQLYQRDANGEIVMENGRPKFVQGAKELMAENGIKDIPNLTANEKYVYDSLRKGFDVLYNEINDMRAANGLTPFKRVQDYYPFLRAVSALKKVGLEKELNMSRSPERMMEDFARISQSPFMFRRARPKHQRYRLADEPFDIFDTYASMAYEHIHTTPIVARARRINSSVVRPVQKMTEKGIGRHTFDPMRSSDFKNREVAKYVNEWAHKISGVPMKYEAPPRVRAALNKINSNLSAAILGASVRAVFVQPLALVGTYSNLGGKYTLKGIYDLPNPTKYRRAKLKSDVLETRSPEATITQDLGRIKDMKIGEFPKVARNLSFRMLQIMDNLTAHVTWNGAYAQARAGKVPGRRGQKMSVEEASRYADDAVIRTQGSGLSGEIAPIQYTSWGKTGTMFQTFVINNWNYLAKDVLGLSGKTTIGEALPKVIRYVAAASAANFVFEDLGGMKSPMGRPVKTLMDGIDNDNNAFEIMADTLAELAEPIPLVSGARYGSHLFGPLVQRVGDVTTGGKYGMTPKKEISKMIDEGRFPDKTVQLVGEALGVPGTGQAMRMYRGQKRGESPWGVVAGTYTEPSKRSTGSRKKRSSRTRRSRRTNR